MYYTVNTLYVNIYFGNPENCVESLISLYEISKSKLVLANGICETPVGA